MTYAAAGVAPMVPGASEHHPEISRPELIYREPKFFDPTGELFYCTPLVESLHCFRCGLVEFGWQLGSPLLQHFVAS